MDEPIYTFTALSPATKHANALTLEFENENDQPLLTISRNDAQRLAAELEQYLRTVRSSSGVKPL